MEQQPAPRHDFFQLLAAEAEGAVCFTLLAAGRDAARGFGGRRLRDDRVGGPGVVLSLGCERVLGRVDGVGPPRPHGAGVGEKSYTIQIYSPARHWDQISIAFV